MCAKAQTVGVQTSRYVMRRGMISIAHDTITADKRMLVT